MSSNPEKKYQGNTVPVVGEVMSNTHVAESISSITAKLSGVRLSAPQIIISVCILPQLLPCTGVAIRKYVRCP